MLMYEAVNGGDRLFEIGCIERRLNNIQTSLSQGLRGLRHGRGSSAIDNNFGALFGQRARSGQTDAPAGAGDQRGLAGQRKSRVMVVLRSRHWRLLSTAGSRVPRRGWQSADSALRAPGVFVIPDRRWIRPGVSVRSTGSLPGPRVHWIPCLRPWWPAESDCDLRPEWTTGNPVRTGGRRYVAYASSLRDAGRCRPAGR